MGVTEIFRFRRLFRRGRRVVDNRHLVVGHDKPQSVAESSPPQFPKGTHFLVAYDRDRLSASELDICNNNGSDSVFFRRNSLSQTVVFTMLPGGATQAFQQEMSFERVGRSSETVAVLPTTELREVTLFSRQ